MDTVVRPGRVTDAVGLARVHTLGWQQGYAGLLPDDFLNRRVVSSEFWRESLATPRPRWSLFVADTGTEIVGFALTGPAPHEPAATCVGQLFALYVLADHWGTGLGHRLHEASLGALAAQGFTSAFLEVLPANERAVAFYRRHGWVDEDQLLEEDLGGLIASVALYRLTLPAPVDVP